LVANLKVKMLITQATENHSRRKKVIQFKQQVMMRADRDGVARTAQDYGIAESKLYSWLENARMEDEMHALEKLAL